MPLRVRTILALFLGLTTVAGNSAFAEDCKPLTMLAFVRLLSLDPDIRPFIPVVLQDKKKPMLVDTGSAWSALALEFADELGGQRREDAGIVSITGTTSQKWARVSPFSIGPWKADSIDLIVLPDTKMFGGDERAVGIVGADILSRYDVDIDFGTAKFALLSPDHCEGKVIYWPTSAVAAVPIRLSQTRHIAMTVLLDGKRVTAALDTGAETSTVFRDVAEGEFGLKMGSSDAPLAPWSINSSKIPVYRHRFQSLDFEGVAVGNLTADIIPDYQKDQFGQQTGRMLIERAVRDDYPDMIIGMDVLRHLHIYIAYHERMLYITPAGAPAATENSSVGSGASAAPH